MSEAEMPVTYISRDGKRMLIECHCDRTVILSSGNATTCPCGRSYDFGATKWASNERE